MKTRESLHSHFSSLIRRHSEAFTNRFFNPRQPRLRNVLSRKWKGLVALPIQSLITHTFALLLSSVSILTSSPSLASQSGSIPQESSPLSEKCKNSILNYVENKFTQNSTQHFYFKHSGFEMASHKSQTHPHEFSLAYPGILKDEYDYYRREKDLKSFETSSLKKEESRVRRILSSLELEIEQMEKYQMSRNKLNPLFLQKAELNQELSHLQEREQLNSSLLQDIEKRLKMIELENRFLIFASTILQHEHSQLAHYVHWMKFIEPQIANAKNCSDGLLRKRIRDSKNFFTENKISTEGELADRILDDLTLRSFAEKTKELAPFERSKKEIQRSTASQTPPLNPTQARDQPLPQALSSDLEQQKNQ